MAQGIINNGVKILDVDLGNVTLSGGSGTYKDYQTNLGDRIIAITCITYAWEVIMKVQAIESTYIRITYHNTKSSAREFGSSLRIAYI